MIRVKTGRHNENDRAFTVVEVVVALGIMACSLLTVLGVLRTCARTSQHVRLLNGSILLAERLLGQTRSAPPEAFEERTGEEGFYRWAVTVAPTPVEGLGAVRVRIQWQEQRRPQDYDLVTLVSMKTDD